MNYNLLAKEINRAIDRHPEDRRAYSDLFSVCREWEKEDFEAAHRANRELRARCRRQLRAAGPAEAEAFYEQWRRCLLFDAPHDFDNSCLICAISPEQRDTFRCCWRITLCSSPTHSSRSSFMIR